MDKNYGQAVDLLPSKFRAAAIALPLEETYNALELRLRTGRRLSIYIDGKEREQESATVTAEDLQMLLERATMSSVHTTGESLSHGYITVAGGHRIGICGTSMTAADGKRGLRDISSASIRIAREIKNASDGLDKEVFNEDGFKSTLIISPPGHGKTTALRDLVRRLSDKGLRVSLVDERGELAGKVRGEAQFDVGRCTDVLDGAEKAEGAMQMLRAMSPDVIALDEITDERDIAAVERIAGCGVGVLATVHGESVRSVFSRPAFASLLHSHVFSLAVVLKSRGGKFTNTIEEI